MEVRKMADIIYITEEGLQKLKGELDQLRLVERPMISKLIAEARDKGDLTENAEYSAAKEAQGMLEMKISRLEDIITRSRIIDESKIDSSTVRLLNRVKIKNKINNNVMEYQIVPESEANFKIGKIAISSPIAMGLIGKKVTADAAHDLLQALLPQDARTIYNFHKGLLRHGQRMCVYEHPRCEKCVLTDLCDYYNTVVRPE